MENIHITLSSSQDVPNQLTYKFPERIGSGNMRVDYFSSGLCLYYMDCILTKPITMVAEQPAGCCGVIFNLSGCSRTHTSKNLPSYSSSSGLSAHYVYSEPFIFKADITVERKVDIAFSYGAKTQLDPVKSTS